MTLLVEKIFKRIASVALVKFILPVKNLLYELMHNDYTILSASVRPMYPNWGDDVNLQLCKMINPNRKYIVNRYTWNIFNHDNILCIGSIISWMTTPDSIIWGSGVVYPDKTLSAIPKKVLAVRGPLTRKYLHSHGVNCPEVYGDPALLFPYYYKPLFKKKYKLGIIPHFRDRNSAVLKKLSEDPSVRIIDVQNIKPWHRFIDDICCCEYIATSSLHGLIISDAYEIPNVWIEFEGGEQKRFAFHDYLLSVGKDTEPYTIDSLQTVETICKQSNNVKIQIDLEKLVNSCPFKSEDNEKSTL